MKGKAMEKYKIKVNLGSLYYEVEAENLDQADEMVKNMLADESVYDLTKWADFELVEEAE